MFSDCVSPHLRREYNELVRKKRRGEGFKLGYFTDALITFGGGEAVVEFKATDYTVTGYERGCRAGGAANDRIPVDRYAEVEDGKNVLKLRRAEARWCVNVDGSRRGSSARTRGSRAGRCSSSTRR